MIIITHTSKHFLKLFIKAINTRCFIIAIVAGLLGLVPLKGQNYDVFYDWPYNETPIPLGASTRDIDFVWDHPSFIEDIKLYAHIGISSNYYNISANACVKLKFGNLPEYQVAGTIHDNGSIEVATECYGLHKDSNGDWWADTVVVCQFDQPTAVLEHQNMGAFPFAVATYAETNATVPVQTWLLCQAVLAYPEDSPPTISVNVGNITTTGGQPQNMQAPKNSSVTFNMSATDDNGNYERTRLWVRTDANAAWQQIYNSTAASGSLAYTLGSAATYYFKCSSTDDLGMDSISAMINVQTTP